MQWEDGPQRTSSSLAIITSTITDNSMWWDDVSTSLRGSPAHSDEQPCSRTPSRPPSTDAIGRQLQAIGREAEATATTSRRTPTPSVHQQFREWAEARSNADPLAASASCFDEETSRPPTDGQTTPTDNPVSPASCSNPVDPRATFSKN